MSHYCDPVSCFAFVCLFCVLPGANIRNCHTEKEIRMSRRDTHIRNMLALYDDAIAAGMTQYDAIRSVIGKTHIKAYFLNVLHEQRSVAWRTYGVLGETLRGE